MADQDPGDDVEDAPGEDDEETISETPAKRKRGRPRLPLTEAREIAGEYKYEALGKEVVDLSFAGEITRRHGHNKFYAARADKAFRGEYYDPRVNDLKGIVMTELGRLGDDEAIRDAHDRLWDAIEEGECSHRAQEQVALLRYWRRGGLPKGTVEGLREALVRTVEQYQEQHDDVSHDLIVEALAHVYGVWKRGQRK
jgi:hypothetical protein